MKIVLIYALLFSINLFTPLLGQDKYFYKKYKTNNQALWTNTMTQDNSSNYVFAGVVGDNFFNEYAPFILTIDKGGSVVDSIDKMQQAYNANVFSIIKTTNGFGLCGFIDTIYQNGANGTAYFYLLDTNYQVLSSKIVGSTQYTNHAQTVCCTPDGGFLLGGEIQPYDSTVVGPPTHPYLIRLDPQGNVLWDTIYYNCCTTYYSQIIKLLPASGGGYYAVGIRNSNFYFGDAMLLKINEDGSLAWSKFISYGHIEAATDMVLMPDGGYILMGAVANHDDFPFTQSGLIVKLNADLEEEWRRVDLFGGYVACKVALTDDGNIFIIGGQDLLSSSLDVELCKISPSGQLLWQRFYSSSQDDYAWAMLPASDGGFVIGGRTRENDTSRVTVLKVNCMGLLTEPQAAFSTYQTGDSPLEVAFANLSQYVYPDSIDGGYYVWDFGDGSPPFVCGQGYGACPALVTHNYATQGQYAATLTAFVCTDTATATQQFSVVPTAVGQVAAPRYHISVLPNPAADALHLETVGVLPASQELQFSLYDAMGRAVRRLALRANAGSVRLGVADLPQGLYFWTCYSPDAVLQSGRVVIGNE